MRGRQKGVKRGRRDWKKRKTKGVKRGRRDSKKRKTKGVRETRCEERVGLEEEED